MSQLKVDSIIPTTGVPTGGGGGIIQIKMGSKTDPFNTASSTMVDTGLSVSITPTSATSKILVNVSLGTFQNGDSSGNKRAFMNIVMDYTNVIVGDAATGDEVTAAVCARSNAGAHNQFPLSFMVLDSPATTSAVTYKVQASKGSDSGTVYLNSAGTVDSYSGNTASTIIVMEVSA